MTWPLQSECDQFYGNPRGKGTDSNPQWEMQNLVRVPCPWPIFFEGSPVSAIRIHKKCAESLSRVLLATWELVGRDPAKIKELRYDRYSGSFNYRLMRGGSGLSMHSYGCAIDWDAEDNQQHSSKHLFTNSSPLIQCFKAEGWVWGGDWSGNSIDAQHVQAARIR